MSLKKYRLVDILVFMTIAVVFELLNFVASTRFDDFKLIFMSYTVVMSIIVIYRWGLRGLFVPAIGAVAACIIAKGTWQQYLAYILGNTIGVLIGAILFQYLIGREKLSKHKLLFVAYLIVDFIFVILFRAIIISILYSIDGTDSFWNLLVSSVKSLFIQDSMSIAISIIIILIASRKNAQLMVRMVDYIKDVQDDKKLGDLREIKRNEKFNSDNPFTEFDEMDNGYILDGGTLSHDQLEELNAMMNQELDGDFDPMDVLTSKSKKDVEEEENGTN